MIVIAKTRKIKSFKDFSRQMEHIITLYYQGYGSERLFRFCEELYFKKLEENGY